MAWGPLLVSGTSWAVPTASSPPLRPRRGGLTLTADRVSLEGVSSNDSTGAHGGGQPTMTENDPIGTIAGLEIREKIGGGGMGAVYKAYQVALDRLVALKTVRPEFFNEQGL